jgi:DNA-binding NarL/FixJ family response regulator
MAASKKDLGLLTDQEKKVLKLVVKAQSNKEIAATLDISPSTVKRHIENILSRLRLKNRVAAAVYAVRMGDCPPETGELKKAA